ncbi:MAG: bifunctional glutamate N-acetyltransferase/amino-acid acetyltransferase ArgJ, partial [Candidatus Micrarchaeota archaeon]
MENIENNVCAVDGISCLGTCIGLKKGKPDFALIYSEKPCRAAGVFTKNQEKGAPLIVDIEHLKGGVAQAIAINSAIANAATGEQGIEDAKETCALAAAELGIDGEHVLVASTGVIGRRLPMEIIRSGISGLKASLSKTGKAAEAIMTTDTKKKEIAVREGEFTIGAIAKGSGMIHPNMATMLCFITTDADFSAAKLKEFLTNAANESFNMLSVDADTSTSDMAIILSTGEKKADEAKFQSALNHVCIELAKKIAADGEGATKLLEAEVFGAKSREDAKKIAKGIICSNLVKTALFGNDPNWGRFLSAIGNSGAQYESKKLKISVQGMRVVEGGVQAAEYDAEKLRKIMAADSVKVLVELGLGEGKATAYGCDMRYDYVRINSKFCRLFSGAFMDELKKKAALLIEA